MHPDLRKSLLPYRRVERKFASCPKCKAALDQLYGPLNGYARAHRDQQVEVVGHDDKFVEKVLLLLAIVIKHVDQESGCTRGLQERRFPRSRGGHEKCALAGDHVGWVGIADGNRHLTPASKGAFLLRPLCHR